MCLICVHLYHMPTMIQIRNVPDEVHRAAKARAALEGLTLSDFALRALREAVARPTIAEIGARIRLLEPVEDAPPAAELVRAERDAR
jgi:plasmid stability protein